MDQEHPVQQEKRVRKEIKVIPAHPEALVEVLLQVYTVQQLILVHDLVCDHLTSMPGEQDRH